jgi:hydroxymethylbilane synthase
MATIRLATRGSPLALRQTEMVAELLRRARPGVEVEPVVVRTRGDRDTSSSLDQIGGQGVFVTEVEVAVTDGRADAAVHSAKDMPSTMPAHLVLGAVPPRADARDGLVGSTLAGLPPGGLVATGSARRRAQLAYLRPDLVFTEARGNMARRVALAEDGTVSAVVVAAAAMDRLGWRSRLDDVLDPLDMLPQVGQGAIAVQCRADDTATRELLGAVDDAPSHHALRAERAVLAALGGSCSVPVGAYAEVVASPSPSPLLRLRVAGLVASGDGRTVVRMAREGDDPERLGAELARALLEGGGAAIDGFDAGAAGPASRVPAR